MSSQRSTREAPTRIDQIIPSIVEHDAVSNHTFGVQRVLREMGFSSDIYARTLGPGVEGRVLPITHFQPDADHQRWVMYQCSIGSPAADVFAAHQGVKLLDYHNITPTRLVERWLPPLGEETKLGRTQLGSLAPLVDYAIADSPFNAQELTDLGYRHTKVVSVMIEQGNTDADPDADVVARYRDGAHRDWLFVGQIAPHKAQHDIIMAFARYREVFDRGARLHLVGREMGNAYRNALGRFVSALGLDDCVNMPGSVSTQALAAYYAIADVFVCLSDHEGFCAPLIEAMSRQVPVVAYGAAAVPDTVGDAGVLIDAKEPDFVAAVVHQLLSSADCVAELRIRGKAQAAKFTVERSEEELRAAILEAVAVVS